MQRIVETIGKIGRLPWTIGDSLLTSIGKPTCDPVRDGSRFHAQEIHDEIDREKGHCEFSVKNLLKMREVAFKFPEGTRHYELPFSVHSLAGKPEVLEGVIKVNPGKPITAKVVKGYLRASLEAWGAEQGRKHETAKASLAAAEAELISTIEAEKAADVAFRRENGNVIPFNFAK